MKFKNFHILFICIIATLASFSLQNQKKSLWCWTKSMTNEPNFILNTSQGGLNWGFCQKENEPESIKYVTIVTTSQIEQSETTSTIKIQLFGNKGITNERILSSNGFERGEEKQIEFTDMDVGKIEKIKLKVIGNQGYRCKNIVFKKGNFSSSFECFKRMEPCKPGGDQKQCVIELIPEGDTPFELTLKTSEDEDSGTNSPVFVRLKGTKGESRLRMFNELGCQKGNSEVVVLNLRDVGDVTGFTLMLGAHGKWKPSYLSVKNLITGMIKNFEMNNAILISPGKESLTVNQNEPEPSIKGGDEQKNSDSSEDREPSSEDQESLNINNPQGGLIEPNEKKNIIKLTCEDKLVNPSADEIVFGPDYPTRNINYMRVLASCPSDCHKIPGTVYGVGIHPESSPICLSAFIDRAVSFYGGIISISIYPGLDNYEIPQKFPTKVNSILIRSLNTKSTKKSFVVSKVDNIDLVEKDIRIMDHEGKLTSEGRVEMRIEGKWGSICSGDNSPESANLICQNLGYRGGEWKNPQAGAGRDFCRTFNGFDYCGADGSLIHFEKITCTPQDTHFNKCNKQLANYKVCTHGFDAIISCFNEIYETEIPVPVGVLKLNAVSNDQDSYTGRLEMYNQQKFSPICDLGFNSISANISCKQMGYVKGELVTDSSAQRFRLQSSSSEKFAASGIQCRGTEKQIKECKATFNNIQCKHEQDVVVKCTGDKGDPTGKSQYMPKRITPAPELGKLFMPKISIKCSIKGNDPMFRGDPGSVFLLTCPVNCSKEPGVLSGTGLYTGDSHVCMAAVHSGVLDDNKGGDFAYVKTYGQVQFIPSSRNGVMSNALNMKWISSFSISEVNTGWTNMNKMLQIGGNSAESKPRLSSFLQLGAAGDEANIPKPIFKFKEPNSNFNFQKDSNFVIENHQLTKLSKYSVIARFNMKKFNNEKTYIFSYSGCSGFNIVIDEEDNLILGNVCSSKLRINPRIRVPLNDYITLFLFYEKGVLDITLSSAQLGNLKRSIKTSLEINPANAVGIGRLGQGENGDFNGEINFVLIYDSIIDEKKIPEIINKITSESGKTFNSNKTEDGRACVSPCIDSKPGEGVPPNEAKLDGESNDENEVPMKDNKGNVIKEPTKTDPTPSTTNDDTKKPESNNDYGTYDKSQENNQESVILDCVANLTDKRFNGEVGKVFRAKCPVCGNIKAPVFGTGIYHPSSSICKSANHMGILDGTKQGDILVELTGKKEVFSGSKGKDNTMSASFSKSDRSFKLRLAEELKKLTCETTAAQDVYQLGPVTAKFVTVCPPLCSKSKSAVVYGSEIYSDNSSICLAAIHYGVINDQGGEVEFVIEGEQSSFKSTHGFGINSKERDGYIRSFRFLGHKSSMFFKYSEDYQGQLKEKWLIQQDNIAQDKVKDNWNFIIENRKTPTGIFEKFSAIIHTGSVKVPNENAFASWILLRDSEWSNGIIKFNIKFIDTNPFGILFRYSDNENYFGIEINPKSRKSNIRLFSKINSSIKILDSKFLLMLSTEAWFRCSIILNNDEMKFLMQQEKAREHKLVFSRDIKEISRGTFGFGTNGNNNFYVSGISVDDYKPNQEGKTIGDSKVNRTFEELLTKLDRKEIKKFCLKLFNRESPDFVRCNEPHEFCQTKCDIAVPRVIETLINYKCFKDCIKAVAIAETKQQGGQSNKTSIVKEWEPKIGSLVDFLITGESSYRPGKLTSETTRLKKKYYMVEYLSNLGETKTIELQYPSSNIVKCGGKLSDRKDCQNV